MKVPRPHTYPSLIRLPPIGLALLLALLTTALVAATLTVLPAPPANAVASQGHGRGYLSKQDGVSWLGSYLMADGRFAFCIEVGKPSPVGNEYDETTSEDLPGLSSSDTARLAYIARTWAASPDNDTAAAGQLAVWTITGLAGHTQEYYAARANERAGVVLNRARAMLQEAATEATTSVTARLRLTVPDDRGASVLADLVTNRVGSGVTTVPAGSYQGAVTLVGATFTDGETRRDLANGTRVTILPRSNLGVVRVRADVSFRKLPFGRSVTVGHSASGAQSLLYSANGSAARDDSVTTTAVSRSPFQPSVVTQTSSEVATAGAEISDRIDLRVRPGEGLLDEWGVYRDGESFSPIPVTVKSRLLGPFDTVPSEQPEWPSDAPTVCEVATVVETGAGRYQTKSCRLPAVGHFVWVETIDPADTPAEKGRDRLRPWKSPFGVASEVTTVPKPPVEHLVPVITTRVEQPVAEPGECVTDGLEVTGLDPAAAISFDVESILVGPFADEIADGRDLAADFDELPVVDRVTTTVTGNGSYETDCVEIPDEGHYVFVFRSEGSAKDPDGDQVVEPFSDLVAHRSEMVKAERPQLPPPPPTTPPTSPPTPVSPPPTVPPALAFTGSTGLDRAIVTGLGALLAGGIALMGSRLLGRSRARREALLEKADEQADA